MTATETLIDQAYAAFNARNIDAALALMTDSVTWPKASEGGHVVGKQEIRAYWTRQWQEFDPHVEPIDVIQGDNITADVKVHQLVKTLTGDILFDGEVWHFYTFADGLIDRMDLEESGSAATPSAAFAKH